MVTKIYLNEVSNIDIARRNILSHPLEPPHHILFSDVTNSIYIGKTEILNVPFHWNFKHLTNPHIAIVGITGSGKSYFIKSFITRASFVWNSNSIIIDWAGEYKDWVLQTGGKVISLGKGNYINLMDLGGMKPYDRIKQILRSLSVLTDIDQYPEQKRLTAEAMEEAYLKAKFKMDSREQKDELGRPLEPPTLKDVVKILEEKAELGTYEFPAELDNAIYRLKQFTRPGEDFFSQKSTVRMTDLVKSGLVDIDLSGLPDERFRALGALVILQFIAEKMRATGWLKEKGLRLLVVLDEAWKISRDENSDAVMIIREGRKYGFGLIIASQNPTDIHESIFSNVGTTFILKVKFDRYLDYLQSSLAFSNYIRERIVGFGVGQAAVNMAFQTPEKFPQTFIVARIEGEEPSKDVFIDFKKVASKEVKNMGSTVPFKTDELKAKLRAFGLTETKVEMITKAFERNNRHLDAVNFVVMLERMGVERKQISEFFKEMGIDDATIINIFTKADFVKEGKKGELTHVVLEDEENEK